MMPKKTHFLSFTFNLHLVAIALQVASQNTLLSNGASARISLLILKKASRRLEIIWC